MKYAMIGLIGLILFLPSLFALGISPETISENMYGGECKNITLTITNPHETELSTHLYYTIDLNDIEGLSITANTPFIAFKGNTEIVLKICTVPNFEPQSFTLQLYADANIEQVINTVIQYKGGGTYYKYIDKNVPIEVLKEIIKEVPTTKEVTVYKDKIVTVDKPIIVGEIKQNDSNSTITGLFGLPTEQSNTVIIFIAIISGVALGAGAIYIYTTKKGGEING